MKLRSGYKNGSRAEECEIGVGIFGYFMAVDVMVCINCE